MKASFKLSVSVLFFAFFLNACTESTTEPSTSVQQKLLSISMADFGLYSMNPDGSGRVKLPIGTHSKIGFPMIARGKKHLAFNDDSDILTISKLDGTSSVNINVPVGIFGNVIWSPDGKMFAYSTWSGFSHQPSTISTVNADGSNNKKIYDYMKGINLISFSNDSRTIVFSSQDGIATVSTDGSGEKFIFRKDSCRIDNPLYSPVREEFVFFYQPAYGNIDPDRGFYLLNTDGSGLRKIEKPGYAPRDFSADGNIVLLVDGGHDNEIYTMNRDGSGLKKLTVTNEFVEVNPKFSPDGKFIAFATSYSNNSGVVSIMNPDGSNRRDISPTGVNELFIGWIQ